jgi:hypothetical protein
MYVCVIRQVKCMILAHVVMGDCVKGEAKQLPPIKNQGAGALLQGS